MAAAARRGTDPALVWAHTQALPGGLSVVAAPPDADRARAALSALVPDSAPAPGVLRAAADMPQTVVIVDCGRVDAGSPVMPVVRAADVMVLLIGAGADDLAHLAGRLPEIGRWSARPVLLLAGRGHSTAEVARELGVTPLGRVPEDRRGAAVLCGRRAAVRWGRSGPSRSALGQVARQVATVLAARRPPPVTAPRPAAPQTVPGVPYPGAAGVPRGGGSADGMGTEPDRRPRARRDRDGQPWRAGAAS